MAFYVDRPIQGSQGYMAYARTYWEEKKSVVVDEQHQKNICNVENNDFVYFVEEYLNRWRPILLPSAHTRTLARSLVRSLEREFFKRVSVFFYFFDFIYTWHLMRTAQFNMCICISASYEDKYVYVWLMWPPVWHHYAPDGVRIWFILLCWLLIIFYDIWIFIRHHPITVYVGISYSVVVV